MKIILIINSTFIHLNIAISYIHNYNTLNNNEILINFITRRNICSLKNSKDYKVFVSLCIIRGFLNKYLEYKLKFRDVPSRPGRVGTGYGTVRDTGLSRPVQNFHPDWKNRDGTGWPYPGSSRPVESPIQGTWSMRLDKIYLIELKIDEY